MEFPHFFPYFGFAWTVVGLFFIVGGRYLAVAGVAHLWLTHGSPARRTDRWLGRLQPGQVRREIRYSLLTSLIFATAGAGALSLWAEGWPVFRGEAGLAAGALQLAALVGLHEVYFYWTHRLMHHPRLFWMHRIHHLSRVPSPWTSFAFHPAEAAVQAAVIPLFLALVPTHPLTFLLFLAGMTLSGVVNHLGFEIFPRGTAEHPVGKWLVGPTHHAQHHSRFRLNYGLYFTVLDRWFGTESPEYGREFTRVTSPGLTQNDSPSVARATFPS